MNSIRIRIELAVWCNASILDEQRAIKNTKSPIGPRAAEHTATHN